jgi:hypothetical protein
MQLSFQSQVIEKRGFSYLIQRRDFDNWRAPGQNLSAISKVDSEKSNYPRTLKSHRMLKEWVMVLELRPPVGVDRVTTGGKA